MAGLIADDIRILRETLDCEYRRLATDDRIIRKFGASPPLVGVRAVSASYVEALCALHARYGLRVPADRWRARKPRFGSAAEAYAAAISAEIENAALYQSLLSDARDPEIRSILRNLSRASHDAHLPALKRCAGPDRHRG